ncbi:hypothetical protein ACIGHN_13505 [Acidovorax sp. NPDC077693]|uniref:hypothetical protein n=1 Tax=unclassified Acidovorax TaxID=2684926 RepID=UPI0037C9AFE1
MHARAQPTAGTFTLRISGKVTRSTCRYTRHGVPVVELEIEDGTTGQTVCISHHYPDKGTASCVAARSLASRMQGQHADLQAINPRFKAKRLECEADLINPPQTSAPRADLE